MTSSGICYCQFRNENKLTSMNYLGKGKWKCPKCQIEDDQSEIVYNVRINVYEEDNCKVIEVIKPFDKRLLELADEYIDALDKDCLQEDLNDFDIEKRLDIGVYDCEILWNWYRCSPEYEDYDLDIEILNAIEVK